ncbi:MAG: L,D-transpeptidase [Bdellovibrionales bacterium]
MSKAKKIVGLLMPLLLLACAEEADPTSNLLSPHTGNLAFENMIQNIAPEDVKIGETYFIAANRLRVRSTPEIRDDNKLGLLILNDQVRVIGDGVGDFVQIEIIETNEDIKQAFTMYLSYKYLSKEDRRGDRQKISEYFMIQNLATEKLRVYKRGCESGDCAHKLILETEIAVGEKDKSQRTMSILGHFHITSWHKFYQDGAGAYPSWYDPKYPAVPRPGGDVFDWTNKKALPYKGASMRGAFGWFAAKVGPNAAYQWTHGTIGWGSDKDNYIQETRSGWANFWADPRSHGCTRTDNESIAYVRQLLPVGSTLIKVYAREAYGDESLSNYPKEKGSWDYILTKNGVRVDGQKADRQSVLAAGTPRSRYLEEGTYSFDKTPTVEHFLTGKRGSKSSQNGNVYGLEHFDMRGVFLIDEGRLVNYRHPKALKVGGYKDQLFPSFVQVKDKQDYTIPACPKKYLKDAVSYKITKGGKSRTVDMPRCLDKLAANGKPIYQ